MSRLESHFAEYAQTPQYLGDTRVRAIVDEAQSEVANGSAPAQVILEMVKKLELVIGKPDAEEEEIDDIDDLIQENDLTEIPSSFKGVPEGKILENLQAQFANMAPLLDSFSLVKGQKIKTVLDKQVKAPQWSKVQEAIKKPEVLARIKELKDPTLLLVPAGMSFKDMMYAVSQQEKDKADRKEPHLPFFSSWEPQFDKDKTGEVVGFDPRIPEEGKSKEDRLESNDYGFQGWEVVVVDGTDEVPEETKNRSAIDLAQQFERSGFSFMGPEAYVVFQMRGKLRGKQYDEETWTWLDAYIKAFSSVAAGFWAPDFRELELSSVDPSGRVDYLGARRSVRVKL
jgi:hypothetical protein